MVDANAALPTQPPPALMHSPKLSTSRSFIALSLSACASSFSLSRISANRIMPKWEGEGVGSAFLLGNRITLIEMVKATISAAALILFRK